MLGLCLSASEYPWQNILLLLLVVNTEALACLMHCGWNLKAKSGTSTWLLRRGISVSSDLWRPFPDSWFKWGDQGRYSSTSTISPQDVAVLGSSSGKKPQKVVPNPFMTQLIDLKVPSSVTVLLQNWCWPFTSWFENLNGDRLANKTAVWTKKILRILQSETSYPDL